MLDHMALPANRFAMHEPASRVDRHQLNYFALEYAERKLTALDRVLRSWGFSRVFGFCFVVLLCLKYGQVFGGKKMAYVGHYCSEPFLSLLPTRVFFSRAWMGRDVFLFL
jgi:hypothetical protein